MLSRAMFYLRFAAAMVAFGLICVCGAMLVLLGLGRRRVARAVAWLMSRTLCPLARLRVTVRGEERLNGAHPCVIVGNQQSVVCYAIYARLYARFPDSAVIAKMVGKWDIPLVAWLFRATGNLVVDPGNPLRSAVSFVNARKLLQERGTSIWIGAEGTRWGEAGRLGPFKRGAFQLAVETGAPIVPLVISPLKPKTDLRARLLQPNHVELRVLEPIPTAHLTEQDIDGLRDDVWGRMQAALTNMARERDVSLASRDA